MHRPDAVVIEAITAFLSGQTGGVPIAPQDRLLEEGIIDSQSMLALIIHIEETYNVFIDDTEVDIDNFGTIEQIEKLVSAKRADAS